MAETNKHIFPRFYFTNTHTHTLYIFVRSWARCLAILTRSFALSHFPPFSCYISLHLSLSLSFVRVYSVCVMLLSLTTFCVLRLKHTKTIENHLQKFFFRHALKSGNGQKNEKERECVERRIESAHPLNRLFALTKPSQLMRVKGSINCQLLIYRI